VRIEVPEDIRIRAEADEIDLRVALAIQLYVDNRIDYTDACTLSHLKTSQFSRELVSRGITVQQYPPAGRRQRNKAG